MSETPEQLIKRFIEQSANLPHDRHEWSMLLFGEPYEEFDPKNGIRVLEEGEDFDGLEYTNVRIMRTKRLIVGTVSNLAEYSASLARLEEKKRKLLGKSEAE